MNFLNRKRTYKSAKFSITGGRQYSVSLDPAPSIHRGPVPVVLDNWNIHHTKVLILKFIQFKFLKSEKILKKLLFVITFLRAHLTGG